MCGVTTAVLLGCAFDLAHVSHKPAQLSPRVGVPKSLEFLESVSITQAPCGYGRTLRKGTHWDFWGAIAEGEVYKPRDQTLTVECSNVHEAYIVVVDSAMVGFYLPVESGFVSISRKIDLPVRLLLGGPS